MSKPLSLRAARAEVLAAVADTAIATERVPLLQAHGRTLAVPVHSDGPWPATDRSAMDGFAFAHAASEAPIGLALSVVGESLAGHPFVDALPAGSCIRIMTGAVLPAGADRVIPVEGTNGFAAAPMVLAATCRRGANIRPRGSELTAGALVLAAGQRVRAAEIGVLAVLGHAEVPVAVRPAVAIVATGDEIVAIDAAPLPHQVRESNSWALSAQIAECGASPVRLGVAPDEPEALAAMLARGLAAARVLLTIGGISKGSHDLVQAALQQLGVRTVFHGIDLKPGKPTYFGVGEHGGERRYVFGLPGNPASAFTVFDLLVRPLLLRLLGQAVGDWRAQAPAAGAPWQTNGRLQAVPARLLAAADGTLAAALVAPSPSGDPFGLVGADCYALVAGQRAPTAGARIDLAGSSGSAWLP
jgi:molybdopterin molybdotransferase